MRTRECYHCKKHKPEHKTRTIREKEGQREMVILCWDCVYDDDNTKLFKFRFLFKKKAKEKEVELSKKEREKEGRKYKTIEIPPKIRKYE